MESTAEGSTRHRLIEAACETFAEKGYRDATIPEICRLADANVAAVNYYFTSKENLYIEVWRYAVEVALAKYPIDGGLPPDASPEERLRAFITAFVRRVFDPGKASWLPRLQILELSKPTEALETLFEVAMRPQAEKLDAIIQSIAGRNLPFHQVKACAFSVIGQCMFYALGREARKRLFERKGLPELDVEKVVEHVTRFSLIGIKAATEVQSSPVGQSARP